MSISYCRCIECTVKKTQPNSFSMLLVWPEVTQHNEITKEWSNIIIWGQEAIYKSITAPKPKNQNLLTTTR